MIRPSTHDLGKTLGWLGAPIRDRTKLTGRLPLGCLLDTNPSFPPLFISHLPVLHRERVIGSLDPALRGQSFECPIMLLEDDMASMSPRVSFARLPSAHIHHNGEAPCQSLGGAVLPKLKSYCKVTRLFTIFFIASVSNSRFCMFFVFVECF